MGLTKRGGWVRTAGNGNSSGLPNECPLATCFVSVTQARSKFCRFHQLRCFRGTEDGEDTVAGLRGGPPGPAPRGEITDSDKPEGVVDDAEKGLLRTWLAAAAAAAAAVEEEEEEDDDDNDDGVNLILRRRLARGMTLPWPSFCSPPLAFRACQPCSTHFGELSWCTKKATEPRSASSLFISLRSLSVS